MNKRLKKLIYQSNHRGTRELDFILGGFSQTLLVGLNAPDLDLYEAILNETDNDLTDWIMKGIPCPYKKYASLLEEIRTCSTNQHANLAI